MAVLFPKWMNFLPTLGAMGAGGGGLAAVLGIWYYFTPAYWEVGYMPEQPGGGFNHQLHAGQLGIDCRYCHSHIESSSEANIPNVATCIGCHADGRLKNATAIKEKTDFLREAYAKDESVEWRRVHKLPDYVRNFPHAVHLNAGVSCFMCHGQIQGMVEVRQVESLSMGWCLDCHRKVEEHPERFLVPPDKVTDLQYVENEWMSDPESRKAEAEVILDALRQAPPQDCGACHN